jgi:putative acetyltransferase
MLTCMYLTEKNPDFLQLVHELDLELAAVNGELQKEYDALNKLPDDLDIMVCYDEGEPVGCAALKMQSATTAEIKRVYVRKAHRRHGVAVQLLQELENIAQDKKLANLILETSPNFIPAVTLYRSLGYEIIDNYGPYIGKSTSVCFGKKISG